MTVYRLEDPYGRVPTGSPDYRCERHDGWRAGFRTQAQLLQWYGKVRIIALNRMGYTVMRYDVPTIHGVEYSVFRGGPHNGTKDA